MPSNKNVFTLRSLLATVALTAVLVSLVATPGYSAPSILLYAANCLFFTHSATQALLLRGESRHYAISVISGIAGWHLLMLADSSLRDSESIQKHVSTIAYELHYLVSQLRSLGSGSMANSNHIDGLAGILNFTLGSIMGCLTCYTYKLSKNNQQSHE